MKKTRLIFISTFLLGMLFTLFVYIPLLEEENTSHQTELIKKVKENDTGSGDDTNGDDDTNDTKTEFDNQTPDAFSCSLNAERPFYRSGDPYKHLLENKNTPPPKV